MHLFVLQSGITRYLVELKGGAEKLKLFSWVDQDVSDVVKHKVNAWLSPESATSEPPLESPQSNGYGSAMSVEKTQEESSVQSRVSPDEVPVYKSAPNLKEMKGGKWVLRVFLGVFLTAGTTMIIFGVSNIITAKDSETWPSVEGVISKSKISISESDDSTTYGADVSYEFRVNDTKYKGDKVTISEVSTSSRSRAKKIVKRYPKRKKVAVYYDPADPERNVLERGLSAGSWLLPGIGLAFFTISLIILIATVKANRKESKKDKRKKNQHSPESIQSRYGKMD